MKKLFFIAGALLILSGCTTMRPIAHNGERLDYFSRYVSDSNDSVQQLALYEKSMTFELLFLRKTTYNPQPSLLYYYGSYVITDEDDIVFYIYAKDPRLLGLLENTENDEREPNGPVVQSYHIETFSRKMIRLRTRLPNPLFHLFFGPIENGKPPTIFTEI